jgi:hypothetical protein
LQILERHKLGQQWQKDNGEYIPHASTWLNGRRWEDEISSASATQNQIPEMEYTLFASSHCE